MASSLSLQGLTPCSGLLPTPGWFLSQELSLSSLIPSVCAVVISYHCDLFMKKLGPITSNALQMTECITSHLCQWHLLPSLRKYRVSLFLNMWWWAQTECFTNKARRSPVPSRMCAGSIATVTIL